MKKKDPTTNMNHWAYENKKKGSKISTLLKSVNELSQMLAEGKKK